MSTRQSPGAAVPKGEHACVSCGIAFDPGAKDFGSFWDDDPRPRASTCERCAAEIEYYRQSRALRVTPTPSKIPEIWGLYQAGLLRARHGRELRRELSTQSACTECRRRGRDLWERERKSGRQVPEAKQLYVEQCRPCLQSEAVRTLRAKMQPPEARDDLVTEPWISWIINQAVLQGARKVASLR